ncbi:MAG: Mur ligase middle domain protein [Candidatus Saccharibacteria bacterium]|nr:Mur ligase middle domain protein [Candidatus Saccharibacteria bacterium]
MIVKTLGKAVLCTLLEHQVKVLRRRNQFLVVAVAGSVGKTSTKLAIARTLGATQRVQFQDGNYNDRLTVPLVIFGHREPGLFNLAAWLKILWHNQRQLRRTYDYQFVVAELGTDAPGQMARFAYLKPDLYVLTSISPEHMEYFKTLEAVAIEETALLPYARAVLVNGDDCDPTFLPAETAKSYGFGADADYRIADMSLNAKSRSQQITVRGETFNVRLLGQQGAKIAAAAYASADMLGLSKDDILTGLAAIAPTSGRMQLLDGVRSSVLIDDTYNSSPIAVKAALDVLYAWPAGQRIAILGTMNEMGAVSEQLHREIGAYCDPEKLDVVVTIGEPANQFTAAAAESRGCKVLQCIHPRDAGEAVLTLLKDNAVVLAKGSQNRVFAEEALVPLLENPEDVHKLVRQSAHWQAIKAGLPH